MMNFQYKRTGSWRSFLWSLWLRAPTSLRAWVYGILLQKRFIHRIPGVTTSLTKFLPFGLCAKRCWSEDEPAASEFVRTHTTIPIPQVLDLVPIPVPSDSRDPDMERKFLMISVRMPDYPVNFGAGGPLRFYDASPEQLQRMEATLANWLAQMQTLESPYGDRGCGMLGGSFRNMEIKASRASIPPTENVAEFHSQFYCKVPSGIIESDERARELLKWRSEKTYRMQLVHGDLIPENLLADEDLRLTGFIDWECAAWMPAYWEAVCAAKIVNSRWGEMLKRLFPQHEQDLELHSYVQYNPWSLRK